MRRVQHFRTSGRSFQLVVLAGLCLGCVGQGGGDHVESAVISPDGKYFAQSTGFGTTIHEVGTGNKVRELPGAAASNLKFSADAKYLVSGRVTDLTLWDWVAGKSLATWK